MPAQLVVQKYGGSSLADADRIRHVARRIARERATGSGLVVVVSAMGDTTDHCIELAARITDEPDPREMDLLLATGEHMSGTLVAMALHALGRAGDLADRRPGRHPHRLAATVEPASPTSIRRACATSSPPAGSSSWPASRARPTSQHRDAAR